jgi:hypothetical protein
LGGSGPAAYYARIEVCVLRGPSFYSDEDGGS